MLERYVDLMPDHMRHARDMVEGWGGRSDAELGKTLRKFAKADRTDAFGVSVRLLNKALEYMELFLDELERR